MMALDVRRSHLSGQSASVLDSMTSLYSLNIAYSHIKPADLSPVCIGRLIFFSMDASQLDDAGVDALKAVRGKAGTPFHDFVLYDADKASLERLLQLNLTFSLRLGGEPVSADCVPLLVQLAKQNNLKQLSIDSSKLTRDESLQLRNEIGGCLLQQVPQHHYDSMDERSVPQSATGLW